MAKRARMAGFARLSFDHGPRLASTMADVEAADGDRPIVMLFEITRVNGDQAQEFRQEFVQRYPPAASAKTPVEPGERGDTAATPGRQCR